MTKKDAETFVNELLGLSRIPSSPFVIQLYSAFRDITGVSYVMELLAGGDLRLLLRLGNQVTEKMIAYVIGCTGAALHHVHSHRMIHRDVKPENIMFTTKGIPKLIDFGISYLVPPSTSVCLCQGKSGTTQYIAPEALVPQLHCHGYESDFWSLGVVMFEMMFHKRPFETHAPSVLVRYSEATYQSTWEQLLERAEREKQSEMTALPASPALLTGIMSNEDGPEGEDQMPSSPPSSLEFGALYRSLHPLYNHSADEEIEEEPLPTELLIPLPDLLPTTPTIPTLTSPSSSPSLPSSPAPKPPSTPPSENCISLLHSLLDVRIHKRYGVNENYSLFTHHPLFISHDIDLNNTASLLSSSPVHPNLDQVGMHIWNRFFAENLEESVQNSPSCRSARLPTPVSQEIDEYLSHIQDETPLFYESKQSVLMRTATLNKSAFRFKLSF
jgi:serine/threonine protein kinase